MFGKNKEEKSTGFAPFLEALQEAGQNEEGNIKVDPDQVSYLERHDALQLALFYANIDPAADVMKVADEFLTFLRRDRSA